MLGEEGGTLFSLVLTFSCRLIMPLEITRETERLPLSGKERGSNRGNTCLQQLLVIVLDLM